MRKWLGNLVGLMYVVSGVRWRKVRAYHKPGSVLSLCGHNPEPRVLDCLLAWLKKNGFTYVDPDELLRIRKGELAWKPKIAWLTFDDGGIGFRRQLLPILEKYSAKATIFVPPHEIDRGQLWTSSIKGSASREEFVRLYGAPVEEREAFVDSVLKAKVNPRRLMTKDELIDLSRHPLITLENHTWSHLSCFHRPTSEVVSEAQKTQQILTEWTGRVPKFLCYPFGHYGPECDEELFKIGLIGVRSDCGEGSLGELGRYRNMFRDDMGKFETIGRALNAWPTVRVPDAQGSSQCGDFRKRRARCG